MADLPLFGPYLQSLRRISYLFRGFAFFEAQSSLWGAVCLDVVVALRFGTCKLSSLGPSSPPVCPPPVISLCGTACASFWASPPRAWMAGLEKVDFVVKPEDVGFGYQEDSAGN